MSIAVYIRKEYFRAVDLTDKSMHILEFRYRPETVDVYEKGYPVFHMQYYLESKTKAEIIEFYLEDFALRGKGYGTVCMNEITDQLKKKRGYTDHGPCGVSDGAAGIYGAGTVPGADEGVL